MGRKKKQEKKANDQKKQEDKENPQKKQGKKENPQKKQGKKEIPQKKQGQKGKPEKKRVIKVNRQRRRGKKGNPQTQQEERANPTEQPVFDEDEWIDENKDLIQEIESLYNKTDSPHRDGGKTSSENHETDDPETLGEKKDTNLPRSDCPGPSTSRPSGQNTNQQSNCKDSFSKQTSSEYTTEHQEDPKNGTRRKRKKAKNNRILQEENFEVNPNLPAFKHAHPVNENMKLVRNNDEAIQSCTQSVPMKSSNNKKCQRDGKVITQVKAVNKAAEKVETLEPNKSMQSVSYTLKSVRQKERSQNTEFQQKLRTCEEEKTFLIDQERKLLSPAKALEKNIQGKIEVLAKEKSVKKSAKESSLSFEHEEDSGKIYIRDRNIQFSIHVPKDIQVVCKSRTRLVTYLVEDVKSSSGALEKYAKARPEDVKTDLGEGSKSISGTLEEHATGKPEDINDSENQKTSITNCDSHTVIKVSNKNFSELDDQATVVADTNALIFSEQHGATGGDANRGYSSVGECPKERNSSRITSEQKKFSKEYEKDVQAACEKYYKRVQKYI